MGTLSIPIGSSWAAGSWADDEWATDTWADAQVPSPVVVQEPVGGGHRIPNTYVDIDLRRARARAAKRRLDEERKRLAELKKQESKVVVQYKAIALPELTDGGNGAKGVVADRARILELEIKEYEQRVALQAERVKEARKVSDQARKEAERRQSDAEEAMRQHQALLEQSEWERIETERLEQEEEDETMQALLVLIHDDEL